jgi:cell division initiation protein
MITVKDVRDKDFGKQKNGYNMEEVDEFLDELADQLEMLIRENRSWVRLVEDLKAMQAAPAPIAPLPPIQAPIQAPIAPVKAPIAFEEPRMGDEPTYFRNLEATLRETLISAQRIADETTAEARKKAKQLVSSAEEEAERMVATAKAESEAAKAERDEIKRVSQDYRMRFTDLVQKQMRALGEEDALFS